jgi:hypothetical protein
LKTIEIQTTVLSFVPLGVLANPHFWNVFAYGKFPLEPITESRLFGPIDVCTNTDHLVKSLARVIGQSCGFGRRCVGENLPKAEEKISV